MSARKFREDVGSATAKVQRGAIPGVAGLGRGDSNGEIVITYHHANLPHPVRIQAVAQAESEYPDGNNFIIFTESDDAPPQVMRALEHVREYLIGITVTDMVMEIANAITSALATDNPHGTNLHGEDEEMTDVEDALLADADPDDDGGNGDSDDEENDGDDDDNDFIGNDDEYFGLGSSRRDEFQQLLAPRKMQQGSSPLDHELSQRIRSDLRAVKQAGFRVGVLNGLGTSSVTGIVCVSIRVSKLGLSEDALVAWDIPDTDYVVLLVKYDMRYYPLEKIAELAAAHSGVQFRLGLCKNYKPAQFDAVSAFSKLGNAPEPARSADHGTPDEAFRTMFLSASLDQFMTESLISIVKLRLSGHRSWDQANTFLLHNSSLGFDDVSLPDASNNGVSDNSSAGLDTDEALPGHILMSDHLAEAIRTRSSCSFPLVAMQFAMQYFARCTQYCLRCHRKVKEGFEALRPYVCSNPLCLFQYMTMGLGPNVEHEILTEPSVVDLLVSLCYASLQGSSRYQDPFSVAIPTSSTRGSPTFPIREFPKGLRLRVPNLFDPLPDRPSPTSVELDRRNTALLYGDEEALKRLRVNQWLVLRYRGPDTARTSASNLPHLQAYASTADARITEIFPDQRRVDIVLVNGVDKVFPANMRKADVYHYDVDFDELTDAEKSIAMQRILNTLPPITTIHEYLSEHPNASLRSCEQVSPAAATLLVWIVSSNRSCINEIGTLSGPHSTGFQAGNQEEKMVSRWTVKNKRKKEFIPGMNGYIQFRFSQGAPDKELRFNKALQVMAQQKDLSRHPTIFAWHGSDVANWHSILRSGLDFKEIKYGRAFGNGVYFSPHFTTSTSYAASARVARWPNSALNVQSILSLNEIINVPELFVSCNPHYVVHEQDWHQCRYLFVSSSVRSGVETPVTSVADGGDEGAAMLAQAPGYEVRGPAGQALSIPVASMPARSGNPGQGGLISTNKRKFEAVDEDSGESSDGDLELLAPEIHGHSLGLTRWSSLETILARDSVGHAPPTPTSETAVTDFRPGTLDLASLPRLAPPSWATPTASRAIGRELQKLQLLQASTQLAELGWYINFEAVSNMFQWIVELHSFDTSMPLAKDMKTAGVTSIVMEFRFGRDWPMAPPFVRVVRPRFMLFAQGGGGHVTAGGAMCMELLTNSGWSPANSMESVILQVRMALCSEERGARLDLTPAGRRMQDYGVGEAVEAYIRAAQVHGWEVPKDLRMTAYGGAKEQY